MCSSTGSNTTSPNHLPSGHHFEQASALAGAFCCAARTHQRLKPNTSYFRNGYEYATDAYGRIRKAAGELRLQAGGRSKYMQGLAGLDDGRQVGDAGGHLIGAQFGGAKNNANLVAMMHEGVNAYPKGTWGSMEKEWAEALQEGKKVHVEIEPIYKDATARPHIFQVFETINGVSRRRVINNF